MKEDFCKSALKEAPVGYACNKIIFDKNGIPCDYEFLDVNSAFADLIGLAEKELVGKRFSEIFPELREKKPEWISMVGDIAVNGGENEFEQYADLFDAWFKIKIISPEKNYFILYILDTSTDNEQQCDMKSLNEILEEPEFKYKSMSEEKDAWERRLHEIADVLKLENDLQFQRIIENLPFSLHIDTFDGVVLYANTKCLELFDMGEEIIGTNAITEKWVDPGKREQWIKALKRKGVVNDFEMRMKTSKGREFWSIGSGIAIRYQDRACILSTQLDITERKRMESALKHSEEKYRLLTEFTSDVIWVLNLKKQKYTYISPSIYYLTGYTSDETVHMHFTDPLTPESVIIMREAIERGLQEFLQDSDNPKSYILEIRQKCRNGNVIWIEVSSKYRYNNAGEIEIIGASRNIEERKRAEREVLYLSYHDQLTGLYNRRFYEEELERINYRWNLPVTLVIADVNGLKLTNDAFGHFSGDSLLKQFTSILNKELKAEDVAARIGGDEFVLLLPKTDSASAESLVGRIKESIRGAESENSILSVSFGWATKETLGQDFSELFIQAEDNMYHSKLVESTNMKSETIRLAMRKLHEKNAVELLHSERVGKLCREIGEAMNLANGELLKLELLGRMHDIGKIGIQDDILNKLKRLTETEWMEIKRHPEVGYQILRSADEFAHIAESVLSHHERADGKGYPRNLKLKDIPLQARILAVAEAYDVMTHGDLHRSPSTETEAVRELTANSGTQFDREIVEIFIEKVVNKKGRKTL